MKSLSEILSAAPVHLRPVIQAAYDKAQDKDKFLALTAEKLGLVAPPPPASEPEPEQAPAFLPITEDIVQFAIHGAKTHGITKGKPYLWTPPAPHPITTGADGFCPKCEAMTTKNDLGYCDHCWRFHGQAISPRAKI
jgi:hypothetical protein